VGSGDVISLQAPDKRYTYFRFGSASTSTGSAIVIKCIDQYEF
jgi:hypothetical protein